MSNNIGMNGTDMSINRDEELEEFLNAGDSSEDDDFSSDDAITEKAVKSAAPDAYDPAWDGYRNGPRGKCVQYAFNGPGFIPTTATIPTLPPNVYGIESVNEILTLVPAKVVTDELLRLPDSRSDEVIAEVEKFWARREIFKQFGFLHKRGFLLWGPPGSGKTCTIKVVMNEMVARRGIVILSDKSPSILSYILAKVREIEPERPIAVVIEDIDTVIERHGEAETLSLLDGELSIDNVVFIATTNYPENLDGRIKNRPSRFDKVVKIGMPNAAARRMYLESRKLPLNADELSRWVNDTDGFSIAHLKELIVAVFCFDSTFELELKRLKSMSKQIKSTDSEQSIGFGA